MHLCLNQLSVTVINSVIDMLIMCSIVARFDRNTVSSSYSCSSDFITVADARVADILCDLSRKAPSGVKV